MPARKTKMRAETRCSQGQFRMIAGKAPLLDQLSSVRKRAESGKQRAVGADEANWRRKRASGASATCCHKVPPGIYCLGGVRAWRQAGIIYRRLRPSIVVPRSRVPGMRPGAPALSVVSVVRPAGTPVANCSCRPVSAPVDTPRRADSRSASPGSDRGRRGGAA